MISNYNHAEEESGNVFIEEMGLTRGLENGPALIGDTGGETRTSSRQAT